MEMRGRKRDGRGWVTRAHPGSRSESRPPVARTHRSSYTYESERKSLGQV